MDCKRHSAVCNVREVRHCLMHLCVLFVISFTGTAAYAADNGCQPVFDAMTKVLMTPAHVFMSESSELRPGRTTNHEAIYAKGTIYTKMNDKWVRSPMTTQDMIDQEKDNRQHATYSCKYVGDEIVSGQPAAKYNSQSATEDTKSQGLTWISRRTGLPLRLELDIDVGGEQGKSHHSIRYEYGNVQPPNL